MSSCLMSCFFYFYLFIFRHKSLTESESQLVLLKSSFNEGWTGSSTVHLWWGDAEVSSTDTPEFTMVKPQLPAKTHNYTFLMSFLAWPHCLNLIFSWVEYWQESAEEVYPYKDKVYVYTHIFWKTYQYYLYKCIWSWSLYNSSATNGAFTLLRRWHTWAFIPKDNHKPKWLKGLLFLSILLLQ